MFVQVALELSVALDSGDKDLFTLKNEVLNDESPGAY